MLNRSLGPVDKTLSISPKNFRRVISTAWKTSGMPILITMRKIMNPIDERIPNMILNFKGDSVNTADKPLYRQCLFSPLHGIQYKNYVTRKRENRFLFLQRTLITVLL